jgi:hypothetical protein
MVCITKWLVSQIFHLQEVTEGYGWIWYFSFTCFIVMGTFHLNHRWHYKQVGSTEMILELTHWFCFTGLILGLLLLFIYRSTAVIFNQFHFFLQCHIFNGYFHTATRRQNLIRVGCLSDFGCPVIVIRSFKQTQMSTYPSHEDWARYSS